MNENDGHEMIVARMKALEEIALDYMLLHALDTGTHTPTQKELKEQLEQKVLKLCGWRN